MGAKCSICLDRSPCGIGTRCKKWCECCGRPSVEDQELAARVSSPLSSARLATPEDDTDSISINVLTIKYVDLCVSSNGKEHHTDRFDLMRRDDVGQTPKLVVRRGQPFKLRLFCNRPYVSGKDIISLIFTVSDDEKPTHGHGTLVAIPLLEDAYDFERRYEWAAGIQNVQGDFMEVVIVTPPDAPVTKWKLDFDSKYLEDGSTKTYALPQSFYLLFNPWCEKDLVYLPKLSHLSEYVLNDTTLIYRGSYNRIRPSVWKLGQFEKDVLDCALLLANRVGRVSPSNRGDPVIVARALSAAINSQDNDGAIHGRWQETFPNGTPPTKWVGSSEILQKYWQKRKPVKYGQCWVFAGVLSTVARAIGIPSRIVTNYSSAHDTQASLTVDFFVDEKGNKMEEMNSDSIWNYHAWNEVWMERPDLEAGPMGGYGGWQAIDSTPQETSDFMYRCGPASVLAVKMGEVKKPYDHGFLYSEVNADKVFWRYAGPMQPLKLIRKDIHGIGLFISTKAVGSWKRDDITTSYKFSEKTEEERDVMLQALKKTSSAFSRYYLNEEFNEVQFEFELRDDIKIGEPFSVVLRVRNRSETNVHEVSGQLMVETVTYTGKHNEPVKTYQFLEEVEPKTTKLIKLEVTFDDYYPRLLDQSAFSISCAAKVRNTEYDYYAQDDFRVRKPDIKIILDGDPVSREPLDVVIRLLNPLPISLNKGVFQIEGPGIEEQIVLKMPEIPVKAIAEGKITIKPPWSGRHTIVAKFASKELDDVDGFLAFEAKPQPEDILVNGNRPSNEIIRRTDVIP